MDNLKIESFKTQLNELISNSGLSVGTLYLILTLVQNEIGNLYNTQIQKEYAEYQKTQEINQQQEQEKKEEKE